MRNEKNESIALKYAIGIGLNTVEPINFNNRQIYSVYLVDDGVVVPIGLPIYIEIVNGKPIKLFGDDYNAVELFLQE